MDKITRRQFSAGLLTAGTLAATRSHTLGVSGSNETIRAAVIGCRTRGPQLAKRVILSKNFAIKTLCDCDDAVLNQARKKI